MSNINLLHGDCIERLKDLEDKSVQCCVTSPPYWGLRDYGTDGQLGMEKTPNEYVSNLVNVFREVWRVLNDDGTLWLNLGDSYNSGRDGGHPDGGKQGKRPCYQGRSGANVVGLKPKDLIGIPWRVAFALQADGWYLRQDIIWHKPNPMPESVKDRCTKAHEYIFLLSKSPKYYFDVDAIKEPSRYPKGPGNKKPRVIPGSIELRLGLGLQNIGSRATRQKRSVWSVTTKGFKGAHFATFPPDLIEPCILAGSKAGDTVLDPFAGAATTGIVSKKHARNFIGIEINSEYLEIARARLGAS